MLPRHGQRRQNRKIRRKAKVEWKNECEWNKQAAFKRVNQEVVCEQALCGALATGREKEGDLATTLWNLNSTSKSPPAPRRLSCQISANQREAETSANVSKHWKTRAKSNYVIINVISANQHFASTFSMQIFKFQRRSCKLSFLFPLRGS